MSVCPGCGGTVPDSSGFGIPEGGPLPPPLCVHYREKVIEAMERACGGIQDAATRAEVRRLIDVEREAIRA